MFIFSSSIRCFALTAALTFAALCQDSSTSQATAAKAPLDHILGTISSVDKAAQTVTVKEDKTGTEHVVQLGTTKTILKVEPTAKDLKSAVRITADDLEAGDRVDVRGTKLDDAPTNLNARSVILMSARELEATHQQQSAAWAHATAGRVTAVDLASGKITADIRSAGASKSITVQTSPATEFTRYSPATGKADPSQLAQILPGDQLKIIGTKSDDESTITAQRVYSGAFRTISATIASISPDGKSMTVKDLATKKEINVQLNADASLHKLPPMMAGFLAHRLNPSAPGGAPGAGGPPAGIPPQGGPPQGGPPQGGPPAGGMPAGRGDISQMIERTPKIAVSDLKPGDAVVISGVATGSDSSHLMANTLIAGVEPIFQSAPQQRGGGRSVGGDWGLGEMSAPQ